MDPLILNVKESELILSNSCEVEFLYLSSVDLTSQEISVSSGGSLSDYMVEIYVRGPKDKFDMPSGKVGRFLSITDADLSNNMPLKAYLNVTNGVLDKLIDCSKSRVHPRNIALTFHEDDFISSWDNMCKWKVDVEKKNNLFVSGYKFEI
jgi:hypothetical protein